jgi:hypothetical protein
VRTRDIQRGTDVQILPLERLPLSFRGVDFGVLPGVPPIEAGDVAPGGDPIKIGSTGILTFTPLGTSSSGTLYVLGRSESQYAVRVLGATGRIRALKYDSRARRWSPL